MLRTKDRDTWVAALIAACISLLLGGCLAPSDLHEEETGAARDAISRQSRLARLANGGHHTLALHADGSVWAWGNNGAGQLGDG